MGAQVLEEALARPKDIAGLFPGGFEGFAQPVAGEGKEVQGSEQGRQVLLAVAEVVLEMVAVVLGTPPGRAALSGAR